MKRIRIILLMMSVLITLISISCIDENKSVLVDDSIIGVWALDEDLGVSCVVEASDSYAEYAIEEAVKTQYEYFFQDTIQFFG